MLDSNFSGIGNNWKSQSPRTEAMSTSTRGNVASPGMDFNAKNEFDHLLVLVHGLNGRYSKLSNSFYSIQWWACYYISILFVKTVFHFQFLLQFHLCPISTFCSRKFYTFAWLFSFVQSHLQSLSNSKIRCIDYYF